jgi:glucuronosyltransferase
VKINNLDTCCEQVGRRGKNYDIDTWCCFQVLQVVYFGLLLSTFVSYGAHGAKILGIFPLPGKSHFAVGSVLFKELANRGHQVTVLSPFPETSPIANYTSIDTRATRDEFLQTTGTEDYLNKLH